MRQLNIYLTFLMFFVCANCKQVNSHSDLIGTFNKGYKDWGTNLILKKEGIFINEKYYYSDFVQEGEPRARIRNIKGRYKIKSNMIFLFPKTYITKEIFSDSTVVRDSIKYYESDSTFIKTRFNIVKWTGNIYLLSEEFNFYPGNMLSNDFVVFADKYNSGSEPCWTSQPYFAKRYSKERYEKIDILQIPVKWRTNFLDSLVKVVVLDIKKDSVEDSAIGFSIERIILNKGTIDGVREGMSFHSLLGCYLTIEETDSISSKGKIILPSGNPSGLIVGDTLTSWNEIDYGKYVP